MNAFVVICLICICERKCFTSVMVAFCRLFQGQDFVFGRVTVSECGAAEIEDLGTHHGQPRLQWRLRGSTKDATV